jgi:hypothetical protein
LKSLGEREDCSSFSWNKSSLQLSFDSADAPSAAPAVHNPLLAAASFVMFSAVILQADAELTRELNGRNISRKQFNQALREIKWEPRLILTTDGKITADAPAEVSEDGRTMTLDLNEFQANPPAKWSIRIDGP